ncbi:MAG TPA: polysaccharide deacetylase family protein [Bacillota bacterium]|nr:polysaccharide deacetylase family protein [Bacillota bacterium]
MEKTKKPTMRKWTVGLILACSLGLNIWLAKDNALMRIPDKKPEGRIDIIWHGPEDHKNVALTFDDGPVPEYTLKVLDTLKRFKVHATFFVVGQYAEAHPEIIKRMIAEGHEVENHTYVHPYLTWISTKETREEVQRCHEAITRITGIPPRFFRPPHQIYDARVITALRHYPEYDICLWSVALEHREAKTPKAMALRVIHEAHPGTIILAHDGRIQSDRRMTVAAIPLVIRGYKRKGLQFVTLKEMFSLKSTGTNQDEEPRKKG